MSVGTQREGAGNRLGRWLGFGAGLAAVLWTAALTGCGECRKVETPVARPAQAVKAVAPAPVDARREQFSAEITRLSLEFNKLEQQLLKADPRVINAHKKMRDARQEYDDLLISFPELKALDLERQRRVQEYQSLSDGGSSEGSEAQ